MTTDKQLKTTAINPLMALEARSLESEIGAGAASGPGFGRWLAIPAAPVSRKHPSHLCLPLHVAFLSVCLCISKSPPWGLLRTSVIGFDAHPELRVFNFIASAKILFPYKVTFVGPGGSDTDLWGLYWIHCWALLSARLGWLQELCSFEAGSASIFRSKSREGTGGRFPGPAFSGINFFPTVPA